MNLRSITQARRLRVLRFALARRTLGGSFNVFLRNLFSPTCKVLASRWIEKIDQSGDMNVIYLKGFTGTLFFPKSVQPQHLYQTITEQFYPWQWHYYQIPETLVESDVVLDCGAAEGIFSFVTANQAKHIYCIEPLPEFQQSLRLTFQHQPNVTVIPLALGAEPGLAYLAENGISSSITTEVTANPVEIETIDSICQRGGIQPSYIKADLEGYELNLIKGAGHTIRKYKPKIAITTYHRPNDVNIIMDSLRHINPAYQFKWKGIESVVGDPIMLHAW